MLAEVELLLDQQLAFYARYRRQVLAQRQALAAGLLVARSYPAMVSPSRRRLAGLAATATGSLGAAFSLFYGQKALHSREGLDPGPALVISPGEGYNGCYGWLDFAALIAPPVLTVAQTGSIGAAFVQREAAGVNDDCLVLAARDPALPLALFYQAAAVLRLERWRFSYGRKLTPARIAGLPLGPALAGAIDPLIAAFDRRVAAILD